MTWTRPRALQANRGTTMEQNKIRDHGSISGPLEKAKEFSTNDTLDPRCRGTNTAGVGQDQSSSPYSVFSEPAKRWIIFLVALAGFFSPLSANIYFPALNYIAANLGVSLELMNLTITAYLLCQGIVPFIIGGLADSNGRRPLYLAVFTIYFAANVGLALQTSYLALIILRILQSSGSSGRPSWCKV